MYDVIIKNKLDVCETHQCPMKYLPRLMAEILNDTGWTLVSVRIAE